MIARKSVPARQYRMHSASETERFALASAGIQLLVRVRLWHAEVSRVELDARNRFKTNIINHLPLDGHVELHSSRYRAE